MKSLLALSMLTFVGTQTVSAVAMTLGEYNEYRGWSIPANQNPADQGYLFENKELTSNDERHEGYISWLSKNEFEKIYHPCNSLNFGDALNALKQGHKVTRSGWNGKGMWLILTKGRTIENIEPNSFYEKCGFEAPVVITSHIDMKAADGSMVVGWLASQTDMLAEDWQIL